jgi:glycosyltransferase involved in cell wall biosynthesis
MYSFCLYVCGNDADRFRRLKNSLDCLHRLKNQDFEIVLIEQSLDGNFYYDWAYDYVSKYQKVHKTGIGFNQSWVRNLSIKLASGKVCILYDMDMLISNAYLSHVGLCLEQTQFAIGADWILVPTELEMTNIDVVKEPLDYFLNVERKKKIGNLYGIGWGHIMAFNRDWFLNTLGGFLESLYWWGKEDEELVDRYCRMFNIRWDKLPTVKDVVLHQWHEGRDMSMLQQNMQIVATARSMSPFDVSRRLIDAKIGSLDEPKHIFSI